MIVQERYEEWTVLQIPNGEAAYAINGSIDDVLVVTTETKVYASDNSGETWDEVADFSGPMPGLLKRNDSLFIFGVYGQGDDFDFASSVSGFSTDKGFSWQETNNTYFPDLKVPIKYVETENGVSYKTEWNYLTIDGSVSNYLTASKIEKTVNNYTEILDIPFEYILNNLYLDEENRLYVAASYGTIKDDGKINSGDRNSPALVFISKNPLP
ncbi:hypothetical protein [Marivirga arenosa]|nr:hypothetical protein [Marivirga sp. BKB1-2]